MSNTSMSSSKNKARVSACWSRREEAAATDEGRRSSTRSLLFRSSSSAKELHLPRDCWEEAAGRMEPQGGAPPPPRLLLRSSSCADGVAGRRLEDDGPGRRRTWTGVRAPVIAVGADDRGLAADCEDHGVAVIAGSQGSRGGVDRGHRDRGVGITLICNDLETV